ncbi:RNI-like protein [Myriangium duriaei CBS 260.36]|uniref:RNI-like protein n=1 Tax=Myriangium duriaei CBS 260.36 TaxID=1168546 RepID=A0A9P4J597_9PEZI|nr:RNI-like protein [Myriangium duriaei CBS 260.36]
MENVHGVDVSWLHRPQRDPITRSRAPSSPATPSKDLFAASPATPQTSVPSTPNIGTANDDSRQLSRVVTEPLPSSQTPTSSTTTTHIEGNAPRSNTRRPHLLNRSGSDKNSTDGNKNPRRASWISNISSRFSSTSSPSAASPASPQLSKPIVNGSHTTSPQPDLERLAASPALHSPTLTRRDSDELQPYVPQKPKESGNSFFSSITKRLAPSGQAGSGTRGCENGGVCARRTMNVNPNRARCLLPELDHSKLRRVSFSVDVEIASGPKYKDDEAIVDKNKKNKDRKIKERAEGEALKHPKTATDLKENDEKSHLSMEEALASTDGEAPHEDDQKSDDADPKAMTRKQEKKKKSEEERKERKERKRKKAEENGTVPVELRGDDEDSKDSSRAGSVAAPTGPPPKPHDRPTTDPVRIYRRCCQLRESPILKRITEQLSSPTCTDPGDSGTVTCLNLTGSRLQLADFITLGDWLAIVPVRRLLLEDADITDEGLRVVLAGLLAAKKPEPTRVRVRNSQTNSTSPERAGVIEKLILKNNPRVTRIGWKHLAVFLNMCRSIKAIDLSMIPFPDDLPPGNQFKNPSQTPQIHSTDAAEIFAKALAERLGGAKLEELSMSECDLNANKIRRLLDGAVMAGITRIGLAGNNLDEEGFDHVLEYVHSGVCHALDIGCNDLVQSQLAKLADALTHKPDLPFWGLSLAGCDLDTEGLRILFSALVKLPNLRFLDISHNKKLFENDATGGVHLLRKYIPLLQNLKRFHLMDVGINAKQTIGIAEVLPEGPTLAHVSLLENAELSKLVANTDENSQEEACALYASLMAAVRVSSTIICIDIDVPAPDNSEVVKALAKQVVAYCLRNMERLPLNEAMANTAAFELAKPHTEDGGNKVTYPDVLLHLVGHIDGYNENHDNDEPAPDDDYIVGGTGVVKALQYCLGEAKTQEFRRASGQLTATPAPGSGRATPTSRDRDQEAGREIERRGRAKEMSKNLLGSARKIRDRLQPALIKESINGDEMAYRRLLFLDQTLQGMIQRFEDEFPECRLTPPSPNHAGSVASSINSTSPAIATSSFGTSIPDHSVLGDSDEDNDIRVSARPSRRGSEVSLASRALAQEEGRMHRLGHGLRQDILKAGSGTPSPGPTASDGASPMPTSVGDKEHGLDEAHLAELKERLERLSGNEVKSLVDETGSLDAAMSKLGASIQDLRLLQEHDPHGWERFVESQVAARKNKGLDAESVRTSA